MNTRILPLVLVSAALALQRRGLTLRLLERNTLVSGASGRNAAYAVLGEAK